MTNDKLPSEIFVDKDYPETEDNRFCLKDKSHRQRYVLVAESNAQDEVFDFLLGSGPLNGCWWGEVPPGERTYWWRRYLRNALKRSFSANDKSSENNINRQKVEYVANALKNSGKTMDEDTWAEVTAKEAINAIKEFEGK